MAKHWGVTSFVALALLACFVGTDVEAQSPRMIYLPAKVSVPGNIQQGNEPLGHGHHHGHGGPGGPGGLGGYHHGHGHGGSRDSHKRHSHGGHGHSGSSDSHKRHSHGGHGHGRRGHGGHGGHGHGHGHKLQDHQQGQQHGHQHGQQHRQQHSRQQHGQQHGQQYDQQHSRQQHGQQHGQQYDQQHSRQQHGQQHGQQYDQQHSRQQHGQQLGQQYDQQHSRQQHGQQLGQQYDQQHSKQHDELRNLLHDHALGGGQQNFNPRTSYISNQMLSKHPQKPPGWWPPQSPQEPPAPWSPQSQQAPPAPWPPQSPQAPPAHGPPLGLPAPWPPKSPQAPPAPWPPQSPQAPPAPWPPQSPQAPPAPWPPQSPQAPPAPWPPQSPQAPPAPWPPQSPQAPPAHAPPLGQPGQWSPQSPQSPPAHAPPLGLPAPQAPPLSPARPWPIPKIPQMAFDFQQKQNPEIPQKPYIYPILSKHPPAYVCEVAKNTRIPCGLPGISPDGCKAINCCFDGQHCYYGKAVSVQCTKDGQFIVVVARDATLPNIDLGSISLLSKAQGCTHVDSNSDFAIYNFPVTSCGTVVLEEPGVIIYENKMFSSYEVETGPRGAITRDSHYELLFQCRYIGTTVQTVVVEVLPLHDPPLPVAALGPIRVELRLGNGHCISKGCNEVDAAYTSSYTEADYPVTKVLRDPVYVEVQLMEKTDPNLVLTLGRCWTTTSPNPHSLPQWDILSDGCPYRNDNYLSSLVPVGPSSGLVLPSHYRRFFFKMFTFVDPTSMQPMREQVYIHCSTAVCTPAAGYSCEPACHRKRRDVMDVDQSRSEPKVVVSVGPVIMGVSAE